MQGENVSSSSREDPGNADNESFVCKFLRVTVSQYILEIVDIYIVEDMILDLFTSDSVLTLLWHREDISCGKTLGFKDKITCLEKVWRRCLWKLLYWCGSEWQCTVEMAEGIVYKKKCCLPAGYRRSYHKF